MPYFCKKNYGMYSSFIRPLLFKLPPERVHDLTFGMFRIAQRIPGLVPVISSAFADRFTNGLDLFGIHFRNPIGLAAGLDKDGCCLPMLGAFGFSFIETGTVTPLPQPGNEKPRLFRLPADRALINRMGFNNLGATALRRRLEILPPRTWKVAVNIGKNKNTELDNAHSDYVKCLAELQEVADFFVVNVSSPNTPNLRLLQEKDSLRRILAAVQEKNLNGRNRPILVKVAPDLNFFQLDEVVEICKETNLSGIVATNTTISREGLISPSARLDFIGQGGLSGRPVQALSTRIIRHLRASGGNLPIIGVGGIEDEASAIEKLEAGANLIELYTGFIYEGPGLVKRISKAIREKGPIPASDKSSG